LVGYSDFENENVLIIKNSWGSDWGEDGYGYLLHTYEPSLPDWENNVFVSGGPLGVYEKIEHVIETPYQLIVECTDEDGDGYCYWGLNKEKPSHCPNSCSLNNNPDPNDDDINIVAEPDLWISFVDFPYYLKNDLINPVSIGISFIGNEEISFLEDVVVSMYVDDMLYESFILESIQDDEEIVTEFDFDPNLVSNPYLKKTIMFEVSSNYEEISDDNNYFEQNLWLYNYENGFEIYEDEYVFDCLSSNNPEGKPIEMIIGIHQNSAGITINSDNSSIVNCTIIGWYKGVELDSAQGTTIRHNHFFDNFYGISVQESDHNTLCDNNFDLIYRDFFSLAYVYIDSSDYNYVCNNDLNKGRHGIKLLSSDENIITNNNIYDTIRGIKLDSSSSNEIVNNKLINTPMRIRESSNGNSISNNEICSDNPYSYKLLCFNSILNSGSNNVWGNKNPLYGTIDGVIYCDDGWPVYVDDFLACNQCEDETIEGECSEQKPKYCENLELVNNCDLCGCKSGLICMTDGGCEPVNAPIRPQNAIS